MRGSFIVPVLWFGCALIGGATAGCSTTEKLSPTPGPVETADPVAPEAPGTPVDTKPTPAPYPADHPGMPIIPNNGGAVLHDPVIVTVTFPNDALEKQIQDFDDVIGSLSWWPTVNADYGVGLATSGGHVSVATPPPAQMTDYDVQQWIQARIQDQTLPTPTDQTIYTLYYPSSTTISLGANDTSCGSFLGYHSSIISNVGGNFVPVAYAVIGRCGGFDQLTETASHELTEAATDPHPLAQVGYSFLGDNAWTFSGGENADMCSQVSPVTEMGYSLTRVWSNHNAKLGDQPCVPLPPNPNNLPYFNAGVVNDLIKAHPGDTVTTEVDCYSFAPLPNDMTVSALPFSAQNLTITLDKDTCTNGDKLTMTIAIAPTAKKGTDYHYTVQASIDPMIGHLWRGMVRVN